MGASGKPRGERASSLNALGSLVDPLGMAECGETRWVPEDVEVTFSPAAVDCLLVEVVGESKENCGGAEIVMTNGCNDPVVFAGWQFECGSTQCNSIPAGQQGRTPIEIENKEEAQFTFDGSLGLETLQVVVRMSVDEQGPGCSFAGDGGPAGWILVAAAAVAARRRR